MYVCMYVCVTLCVCVCVCVCVCIYTLRVHLCMFFSNNNKSSNKLTKPGPSLPITIHFVYIIEPSSIHTYTLGMGVMGQYSILS